MFKSCSNQTAILRWVNEWSRVCKWRERRKFDKPMKGWLLLLKVHYTKAPNVFPRFVLLPLVWDSLNKYLKLPWKFWIGAVEAGGGGDLIHPDSLGSLTNLVNTWSGVGYSHCAGILVPPSFYTMPYPALPNEIWDLVKKTDPLIRVRSIFMGWEHLAGMPAGLQISCHYELHIWNMHLDLYFVSDLRIIRDGPQMGAFLTSY